VAEKTEDLQTLALASPPKPQQTFNLFAYFSVKILAGNMAFPALSLLSFV